MLFEVKSHTKTSPFIFSAGEEETVAGEMNQPPPANQAYVIFGLNLKKGDQILVFWSPKHVKRSQTFPKSRRYGF